MTERIERIDIVMARTSLKRTTIYAKIKEGAFPAGFHMGRARCWRASEIDAYIETRASGKAWQSEARA
jgi:predicted DNA-binding transcriptional regulator AlpA